MRTLEKVLRYKDLRIHWKIFFTSLKISIISCIKGYHSAIISIPSVNKGIVKKYSRDEINRYVNMFFVIRRRLGICDTCLSHSILLCHMLRLAGLEAKINFGAKKLEEKTKQNPIEIFVRAIENAALREEITSYQMGGVMVR